MLVKVHPYRMGISNGNIIWPKKWPMRHGVFPPEHPVGGHAGEGCEFGDGENIKRLRSLGYWASCFPEGDGITWKPLAGQSDQQCIDDIKSAFGWDAVWGVAGP